MDTLLIIDCGRGLWRVYYNSLLSDPIPAWRIDYWTRKLVNAYHAAKGVGL